MKTCNRCSGRGYDSGGRRCPGCGGSGAVYTAKEIKKLTRRAK